MALVLKDRVKETTSTQGTGAITLLGPAQGYQGFSAIGNGNTTYYCIAGTTEWEVGIGTYNSGSLTRDTVLGSSNNNSLVGFSAGVKDVFCTYAASKAVSADNFPAAGALNTTSPNDTVNVASLTAATASTNGDLALIPKGTGALLADIPDNGTGGGNKRGTYAVDWQMQRAVADRVASGAWGTIGGGHDNKASGSESTVAGGSGNFATALYSAITGGGGNVASNTFSYVGGGQNNTASGTRGSVVGGQGNTASASHSIVGGGEANYAIATYAGVLAGKTNYASGTYSGVVSGFDCIASGSKSFVGSGNDNTASGEASVIGGGSTNTATGTGATVGGGYTNTAADYCVVAGGQNNTAAVLWSGVGSGYGNTASMTWAYVGGGVSNTASGQNAVVAGGSTNLASGNYSFIGGGVYGTTRGITGFHVFPACNSPIDSNAGVTQAGMLVLAKQTTNATPSVLTSDSSPADATNQLVLPNNSAMFVKGTVVAYVTGGTTGNTWTFEAFVTRGANAASTSVVSNVQNPFSSGSSGTWSIAVAADTTNGGIKVTVTGQASTTIRWVCKLESTEVKF